MGRESHTVRERADGRPICARKRRYPRFWDALRARDEMIKDSTMNVFWCGEHQTHHLGHDRVGVTK